MQFFGNIWSILIQKIRDFLDLQNKRGGKSLKHETSVFREQKTNDLFNFPQRNLKHPKLGLVD